MPYVEYPIESVAVSDLHLDVSNYRFASDQPTENAAMNYLWAEEDVKDVATLILRDQYVDNELPLVVREGGRLILLEGNRRVSALLALLTPALAPAHQSEIERLLKRYAIEAQGLPDRIRAMVLPDRLTAAPILARLHIGQSKKPWNLDEQAKFVLAQLTGTTTLEQLKAQLPAIKDVPRVVRMGRVRQRLRATAYSDPQLTEYIAGPKLTMSAFEYAYRNSTIQDLIGLAFDDQARVVTWASTPEQLRALERLLTGFRTNELNTRRGLKANTPEYEALLRDMRGSGRGDAMPAATPDELGDPAAGSGVDPNPGGNQAYVSEPVDGNDDVDAVDEPLPTSTIDDDASADEGNGSVAADLDPDSSEDKSEDNEDESSSDRSGRGPTNPELLVNLVTTGVDERTLPANLRYRWRELRRINVVDFPASATMLMRSVVEASVKEHFGMGNGIDVTGMLSQVMVRVTSEYGSNGQLAHSIATINRGKKDASTVPGTGQWFNVVAHSVNTDVTGQQVHQAWKVVFPLVRFLLTQQPPPPAPTRP